MSDKRCILRCGKVLTSNNVSKEHIIPNAIGGKKFVSGFICDRCNNETGAAWDAELARQLNPIGLYLGIRRTRGKVHPQVFPTSSGGEVQVHPGGRMTIAKPSFDKTVDGNTTHIRVHARSEQELRKVMKGLIRKHAPSKSEDLDDLVAAAQTSPYYSDDMIGIDLVCQGPKAGRSLVKSAVALTFDAGIDPNTCDLALDYLRTESGEPCFGYYYDSNNDIVSNRPAKTPFHCVHVNGDPDTGMILGYIELYGLHRMVMCLSESYWGHAFTNTYAINPVKGDELDLDIKMNLSKSDIRSAYNHEKCDDEARTLAAMNLFDYIQEIDFDRALDQAINYAAGAAWAKLDPNQDGHLTSEQINRLIDDAMQEMAPFIRHHAGRFGMTRGGAWS